MAACSDPGQCSKNQSLFLLLSSQQLLVVSQEGVPQLWSYTSRHFTGCTDLRGKSLNLCLPALREGHSLFLQWHSKYKILFYFSSCQFSRSILHFYLRQQLNSSFLQPRCFLQHSDRKQAGSEAGRLLSPCVVLLPLPSPAACPALGRAAQVTVGICLSQHLLCPKHTHYCS